MTPGTSLTDAMRQWATPTRAAAEGGQVSRSGSRKGELLLAGQAKEWATPAASLMNYQESPESFEARSARLVAEGTRPLGVNLGQQAQTWGTPRASDGDKGGPNQTQKGKPALAAQAANWPTPNASDEKWRYSQREAAVRRMGTGKQVSLECAAVAQTTWPTPRASEGKGVGPEGSKSHTHRLERGYLDAAALSFRPGPETSTAGESGSRPVAPLRLNPDFVEALMGWPRGWSLPAPRWGSGRSPSSPPGGSTDCGSSATASSPSRPPPPSSSCCDTSEGWTMSESLHENLVELAAGGDQ